MGLDHDRARALQAQAEARAAQEDFFAAVEYRYRLGEEALRQNELLRQTVKRRMAEAFTDRYGRGRADAYADVLSLLGPEEAWSTDDEGNPF